MKFITNNSSQDALSIGYNEKYIENMKFIPLQIDNQLNWTHHIDKLSHNNWNMVLN
jgi:hypothetical protein